MLLQVSFGEGAQILNEAVTTEVDSSKITKETFSGL